MTIFRAEQSRAEQSRAEQSRAEQSRAEQSRADIKHIIKRILADYYKVRLTSHKIKSDVMSVEEAKCLLSKLYAMPSFECKGKIDTLNRCELSLIVPVYNSEKFLEECIKSLINQDTERKYEIILINDGSKDGSKLILDKYEKNPKIRVFHQENKGISRTRNRGVELSEGEYIGFVDNDDFIDRNYVEMLLSRAKNTNADIVKCGSLEFDSNTGDFLHDFASDKDVSITGYMGDRLFEFDGFIWGGCYKREFWDKIQFPNGFWYEDMITRFLLYRRSNQFEYIGKHLYYKRAHDSNSAITIWSSKNIKSLDQYYLLTHLLRISKEFGLNEDATLVRMIAHELGFMLGHRTSRLNDKIRKAIFTLASNLYHEYSEALDYYDQYRFCESLRYGDYKLWKLATDYRKMTY